MKNTLKLTLILALAIGLAACSKNVKQNPAGDAGAKGHVTEITAEDVMMVADEDGLYGVGMMSDSAVKLTPIYFGLDQYTLSAEAKKTLDANVEALKVKAINSVTVEGNCDERGTVSYNIALGDKRAKEVKDYYVKRGIPAKNIKIISYGKEKPVCYAVTETCHAQNRRADTVIQ